MKKVNLTINEIDFIKRVFYDASATHEFCKSEIKLKYSIEKKLEI